MQASKGDHLKANFSTTSCSFSLLGAQQLYNSASEESHLGFTALISLHFSHTGLFVGLTGL